MGYDLLEGENSEKYACRYRDTSRVVNLGLVFNSILAVMKVSFGIFGHSKALLADGINSVSDVVYLFFVKLLVRLSGKPADEEHPYGHHQMESIAAVVVGAFVVTTAIAVFWDSINSVFDIVSGELPEKPVQLFTLFVAGGTIVVKVFLMLNAQLVSRRISSMAVEALARDHRNDIYSSAGAGAGIVMSLLGFQWVDPLAGALVAVIILKTGVGILRESADELMDAVPSRELDAQVRELLAGQAEIRSVEFVHAHKFGPFYVINVTLKVDGNLSVAEADRLSDAVENLIMKNIEYVRRVYIHCHPGKE